jgi:hypothetical protein
MRNLTTEAAYWVTERYNIMVRKRRGDKAPWTEDPILAKYRFCNVRREDDEVTKWIAKHWRDPNATDPNLPRAMTLARLVNWPPTLAAIGYPYEWNPKKIAETIQHCEAKGKAWSSAYIVSTNGKPINKAVYVALVVSNGVLSYPTLTQGVNSLQALYNGLVGCMGLGSFMAAQVVADVKNAKGGPLAAALDWRTWAAKGPGSIRGLRRYFPDGLPSQEFIVNLRLMVAEVRPHVPKAVQHICMQDWQNVMCEFDKYTRAKNGEGRPKADYRPNPYFPELV